MTRTYSKKLVIDACVARAAGGEDAVHPRSKACRDFLDEVYRISHRMAMTTELWGEWRRHKSRSATKWLARMMKRGKVFPVPRITNNLSTLREDIAWAKLASGVQEAMLKDVHLLEAAMETDYREP